MKSAFSFFALLVAAAALATAQGTGAWAEVEYYVGDDVTVIRDGQSLPFEEIVGLKLVEGDQIQTGRKTFLELRLMPSGGLVKLSENTTFALESLSSTSARTFKLIYGRVRAKVEKLAGTDSFDIRSDSVVAGVRGTDFGYDLLVPKGKGTEARKPVAQIYCFEGAVVVSIDSPEAAGKKEYPVDPGSMVTVRQEEGEWVTEVTPLTEEIRSFWRLNDFMAVPVAQESGDTVSPALNLPTYARVQAGLRIKNSAIFGGIVLVGLGSVLQGVGAYAYSSGDPMLGLNAVAGGAFLGILAIPVLIFGLSSNPVVAEP